LNIHVAVRDERGLLCSETRRGREGDGRQRLVERSKSPRWSRRASSFKPRSATWPSQIRPATLRQPVKPIKSVSPHDNCRSRPSGRISEVKRVSEYLEESPVLLARPPRPKSWDVLRSEGFPPKGVRGRGGIPGEKPKAHKSLAGPQRVVAAPRGISDFTVQNSSIW